MFKAARTSAKNAAYQFRKILPDNYKDVMFHLRDNCHHQNPLNREFCKCLKMGGDAFVDHFAYKTLTSNLSFMILNENKKIIGAVLNDITRPGDINHYNYCLKNIRDQNLRNMVQMTFDQNLENNIFNKFKIHEVFNVRLMSVDRSYNTRLLAKYLINMCELLAQNQNIKIIKADTFGEFPQKHFKKCGYECLSEKQLDFYNSDGKTKPKLQLLYKELGI